MSRPGSRRGKSAKAKKLTPKQQIAQLTEQNEQLTVELNNLKTANEELTLKVQAMTQRILDGTDNKKQFGLTTQTDHEKIGLDTLLQMIDKLIVKKQIYDKSVECRAAELEMRVTQMTMDISKLTKKTLAYEQGLADILQCRHLEETRDKVYQLQLIAGEEFHHFVAHDALEKKKSTPVIQNGVDDRPDSATKRTLNNAIKLNLIPPSKKFVGETPIRKMNKDLKLYIMKELSRERASGSDWRMLAERVGIEADTIAYWKTLRLDCPMGRVFADWGESEGATVRLLYRHLMSPQLRCTILAKIVSDFYEVD